MSKDFISKEGEMHIKNFKYKGGNLSLSYNYLWSPIAEKILKYTPTTIAPNTITLVGFLLHTFATIVLCLHLPFSSDAPAWALFLYGFCVCAYQMLDNVDGKLARKIQNSTPLGMIMDHGCDALGVICLTAGMGRVVCVSDPLLILWVFVFVMFSFYITAWCQYWSNGIMILGKFNGVDDGIPIIWTTAFLASIFGQAFWRTPVSLFGHIFQYNELLSYAIILSTLGQIFSVKAQSGEEFTKDVKRALRDLIHVGLLVGTTLIMTLKGDFVREYVVGIAIGLAFTMSRSVSDTLVCSTAKMEFKQFSPSVLVYTSAYLGYVLFGRGLVSPGIVVYGVAMFAAIEYFFYVVNITRQITRVLGIPAFSVFKPPKNCS